MEMKTLYRFSLLQNEKEAFVEKYEQLYFQNSNSYTVDEKILLGTVLQNKTEKSVEDYADEVLRKQVLDKRVFLWKAGRLTGKQAKLKDADSIPQNEIVNGRGHKIENAEEFINAVNCMELEKGKKGIDGFESNYAKILDIAKKKELKYVGTVYLITVLFFLSNKEYPIYDFFAHRAIKALYLGKKTVEVFVGAAPDKNELDKVFAMYKEYLFLLKQVFGEYSIERNLDRALWVYGHVNNEGQIFNGKV
ncbi:MAG: hypothetical protein K6G30_13040 [Acetatifactor sp.]|nr:hypothetical protein [Acetatifactor sp.]